MKRVLAAGVAVLFLALLAPLVVAVAGVAAQPQGAGGFGAVLFRDDFTGSTLGKVWSVFRGDNGETGPRSAGNVSVHDGALDLAVAPQPGEHSAWGDWAGGSVCACTASVSTYGRYLVRAMSTGGAGFRSVALTWPVKGNGWPPELDFHEATDPGSDSVTTHYVDTSRPRNDGQDHGPRTAVDVTGWHVYSVEWTPTLVTYLLDGRPVAGSTRVPQVPMWLGLTAAMHGGGAHPATPQHMLVDYVEVDSYDPTAACTPTGSGPQLAAAAARAAGFPADQLVTAVAIAGAESGYRVDATNVNSNGSTDYGLWQINSVHSDLLAAGDWRDPGANARMALAVYSTAGGSWTPWTTYNTGAYRAHLTEAAAAVAGTPSSGGTCTPTGPVAAPTAAAAAAIAFALAQVGKPYQWGGTGNPSFDCSGLTQASYAAAGIALGRTSRDQWYDGPHVPRDQLAPGDLVFWASNTADPGSIHHVAIYLGNSQIVAAPYTGQLIRVEPMYFTGYSGAVRPSAA